MVMKLLKKSEISALKTKERNQEIEQGKQLATRVDALREVAAAEEKALIEFRTKTVASIQADIKAATAERDSILREIKDLTADREVGMTEINAMKAVLVEQQVEAEVLITELNAKLAKATDSEKIMVEERKETKRLLAEAVAKEEVASKLLRNAHSTMNRRIRLLDVTKDGYRQLEKIKADVSASLYKREQSVAAKERDIQLKLDHIKEEKARLAEKERAVNDKYNALLKAQKHLKK